MSFVCLGLEDEERVLAALARGRSRLGSILVRFRLSREDADDLLHDLFLVAIEKLSEIEDLDAWLQEAARNRCRSEARKRRRRERLNLLACPEPAYPAPQENLDLVLRLHRALVLMPAGLRQCLVLKGLGFKRAEIAARTGYTPTTVNKRISAEESR
jgi:RNA polymerase sigma factor (sigma-70 family)